MCHFERSLLGDPKQNTDFQNDYGPSAVHSEKEVAILLYIITLLKLSLNIKWLIYGFPRSCLVNDIMGRFTRTSDQTTKFH